MERKKGACEVCGAATEVITYDSSPADQRAALESEISEVRGMARTHLCEIAAAGKSERPDAREGLRRVCELCDHILNHAVVMLLQEIQDPDRLDVYSLLQRTANVFDDIAVRFEDSDDQTAAVEASVAESRDLVCVRLHDLAPERESLCSDSHAGLKELLEATDSVLDSALVILAQEIGDRDREIAYSLLQRVAMVFDDLSIKIVEEMEVGTAGTQQGVDDDEAR